MAPLRRALLSSKPGHALQDGRQPHGNETMLMMFDRWRKLERALYSAKAGTFDISKIPDIYDSAKYDAIHNKHLGLDFMQAWHPLLAFGVWCFVFVRSRESANMCFASTQFETTTGAVLLPRQEACSAACRCSDHRWDWAAMYASALRWKGVSTSTLACRTASSPCWREDEHSCCSLCASLESVPYCCRSALHPPHMHLAAAQHSALLCHHWSQAHAFDRKPSRGRRCSRSRSSSRTASSPQSTASRRTSRRASAARSRASSSASSFSTSTMSKLRASQLIKGAQQRRRRRHRARKPQIRTQAVEAAPQRQQRARSIGKAVQAWPSLRRLRSRRMRATPQACRRARPANLPSGLRAGRRRSSRAASRRRAWRRATWTASGRCSRAAACRRARGLKAKQAGRRM